MTVNNNDSIIKQVRCPACLSASRQKIANAILLPDVTYIESKDCDENAMASIQFKCLKCKAIVYLNIYKKWKFNLILIYVGTDFI